MTPGLIKQTSLNYQNLAPSSSLFDKGSISPHLDFGAFNLFAETSNNLNGKNPFIVNSTPGIH